MDAVPVEPEGSHGTLFAGAPAEPAGGADCPLRSVTVPEQDCTTRGVPYGLVMGEALDFVTSFLARKGFKQLSDLTDEIQRGRELLDQLDGDDSADALSALRFAANGDTVRLECHDLVVKGSLDFVVTDRKPVHDRPGDAAPSGSDGEPWRPDPLIADEEAGVHWRALPVYATRPFALRACCTATVPASAWTAVARPSAQAMTEDERALLLLYRLWHMGAKYASHRLRVTTQNRRLVRDYREGLRRLLFGVLRLLRSMAVTLLAALSHLAQTPTFLLVVIATVRHYGRRGDSNGHFLPAPALQGIQRRGAACLAALGHAA